MSNMIDCLLEQDNLSETVNPISKKVFEAEEEVKIEERLEDIVVSLGKVVTTFTLCCGSSCSPRCFSLSPLQALSRQMRKPQKVMSRLLHS